MLAFVSHRYPAAPVTIQRCSNGIVFELSFCIRPAEDDNYTLCSIDRADNINVFHRLIDAAFIGDPSSGVMT
jgi:hypothetical protein